ncbi:FYVE, RhoGEF and PH domain-containing protein 3-like [Macrobrachium nipponense]|uniref:FYVE, RhoGEF and PH domain-containing protein 3-like n=1 Tax=Macrobrachium nipponense TaxID=159736 RepID=UPI0030C8AF59
MMSCVRKKIVQEMISSEEAYLKQLHTLDKYFVKPSLEKASVPLHIHAMIFGQLQPIREMNTELFKSLSVEDGNIGTAFLKMAPFLKVYASYAKNYQQAINILVDYERKTSKFKAWLTTQESRPEVQTKLPSLLITPIQRIPRYRLLLEQLLKHTPKDHPHYGNIVQASEAIEKVAGHIEESLKKAECVQRMIKLQEAMKNGQPNIIAPGRQLIREGVLQKISQKGNSSQPRLFFLFTDILMYTKLPAANMNSTSNISFSETTDVYKPKSLECCCILPLRHCCVIPVFDSDRGLFRLKCKSEDMLLFCTDHGTSTDWVRDIKEAVHSAIQRRKTLRKDSSARKPMRKTAIRKMAIQENTELMALKATKLDGTESIKMLQVDELISSGSPKRLATPEKRPWSPGSILTKFPQIHDCLTPPKSWRSRKRPDASSTSSDDEDLEKKVKSPRRA